MTRFLEFLFASMLLSVLATAASPALADNFMGGSGGTSFTPVNCPTGQVVVGLGGRSGAVIDTMQLLCGKANPSGELDPRRIGPSNGGGLTSAVCPPLSAVVAIQIKSKNWRRHVAVSQIILTCASRNDGSGQSKAVFGIGGGDGGNAGSESCPPNTYVGGFAGRSGTWIDALGISTCRPRSVLN